jgi:predicted DNA-binding transcriptional regulator AlpA
MSGNAVHLQGRGARTVAEAITHGERMLTMQAIRELKGIPFCDQYVWELRKRGVWPEPIKFGRRLMFFESEIDAMLARMKAERDQARAEVANAQV